MHLDLLLLHTDAPHASRLLFKTRLTVPQSVLSVFLIVHIAVRSRMALKSYAQPAVFFHILMSFTDAAVAPKTRPPHLLPPLEWRKEQQTPPTAHVINELQTPPTVENSCLWGLLSGSVVSHTFLIHDWKDDFVLYENKRLSEHTINYSHLLDNINTIDKRFSQFFVFCFI